MKKLYLFLGLCLINTACSSNHVITDVQKSDPKLVFNETYSEDEMRFRQNISVKAKGANFVTYEYKDVRVDELASLAIKYCEDNAQGTNAHLKEIILYRNNARRATFDCINLAK